MKKLILITIVVLSGLISLIVGIDSKWINNIFDNKNEETEDIHIALVENFIENANDLETRSKACESSYKIFYNQNDLLLTCRSVSEKDDYYARLWYYNEIEVIGISKLPQNLYMGTDQDRKDYYKIEVSYKLENSETIRSRDFFSFDVDGEIQFTLELPQSEWFE